MYSIYVVHFDPIFDATIKSNGFRICISQITEGCPKET